MANKKVVLHICCGVCAAYCIKKLFQDGYDVVGFYYNPNIEPYNEYLTRREVVDYVAKVYNIEIIEGEYDNIQWHKVCDIYKEEPEGGKRCLLCYQLRLERTFEICNRYGYDFFSTTLTISPYKDTKKIFDIGKSIGKEKFLQIDFKKSDGFKQTIQFAKLHNLYRQNYCGCLYSFNKNNKFHTQEKQK